MKRPSINISGPERIARIVLGIAGAVVGALLLASSASALGSILSVLLVVLGLDMLVTGALGHCPLYQRLGHVPASLRRPT